LSISAQAARQNAGSFLSAGASTCYSAGEYGQTSYTRPIAEHKSRGSAAKSKPVFLIESSEARLSMNPYLLIIFALTTASSFAADAMKFVSPDKASTLVVDKSGRRDIIELKCGKKVHRLFYEDLDSVFKPKIAEAFNASLNKVGKIVLPTFTSASWISSDEVEIKGESSVTINDEDEEFTFTASVSKSGHVNHLAVAPKKQA
jgi:hypothetical protein